MGPLTFNSKGLKALQRDLLTFGKKSMAFASRDTVNGAAFKGQKVARRIINQKMTVRAKGKGGAPGSVQVEKSRTLLMRRQFALLGSTAGFMADQEFGGRKRSSGKHGVPIPSRFSSGEGRGSAPRRRRVTGKNLMKNINLRRRTSKRVTSRRQANLIAVREAMGSGRKFAFLELRKSKGIFKVTKKGINLVADMSRKTVTNPANPWLQPTMKIIGPMIPRIYATNLRRQIRRQRLFRNKRA